MVQYIFQKEHRPELLTLSAPSTIRLKTYSFFQQSDSVLYEMYFTFFLFKSAIAKLCAVARTFHNVQLSCCCCVTWYENHTTFFSSHKTYSLDKTYLWPNHFARGKGLGRQSCCACISHIFQYYNFVGSIQSSIRPGRRQTFARPCFEDRQFESIGVQEAPAVCLSCHHATNPNPAICLLDQQQLLSQALDWWRCVFHMNSWIVDWNWERQTLRNTCISRFIVYDQRFPLEKWLNVLQADAF